MNNVRRKLVKFLPVTLAAMLVPKGVESKEQTKQMIVPLGDMGEENVTRISYWHAVRQHYDLKYDPFRGADVDEEEQFMPISGVMINRFGKITSLVFNKPE